MALWDILSTPFLLVGTVTGLGAGMLIPFRNITSLSSTLPQLQKKLILASVLSISFSPPSPPDVCFPT
jgi:hypothetical protein